MSIEKILCVYLILVNSLTFILFGIDKFKAIMHWWRISEQILLLFVLAGGVSGGWLAMFLFRHKIKDRSFLPPMILITVSWLIGFVVFLIKLKVI